MTSEIDIDSSLSWRHRRRRRQQQQGLKRLTTTTLATIVITLHATIPIMMRSEAFQLMGVASLHSKSEQLSKASRLFASRSSESFIPSQSSLLLWDHDPMIMLCSSGGSSSRHSGVWSDSMFYAARFGGGTSLAQKILFNHNNKRNNQGMVLGFAIHEEITNVDDDHSCPMMDTISGNSHPISSTALSSQRSATRVDEPQNSSPHQGGNKNVAKAMSKVDSLAWNNLPKHLEEWYADASPIKNQFPSSSSTLRNHESIHHDNNLLPAWFPWLPTHTQICALKLEDLKVACGERGLKKSGNKSDLQERLWEWVQQQHHRRVEELRGDASGLNMGLNLMDAYGTNRDHLEPKKGNPFWEKQQLFDNIPDSPPVRHEKGELKAGSLAEWTRSNLKPLLNKREELRRQKLEGKKSMKEQQQHQQHQSHAFDILNPTKEYLSDLTRTFAAPSSRFSNLEVSQMYAAAKHADQVGDRETSKRVLLELKDATPNDARIFRRLARLHSEEGNLDEAIALLQEGLRLHPKNAHLWHGIGKFQLQAGALQQARDSFQKAIDMDPRFPNAYHALGTLEHTQCNIASAMKVLKKGLEFCPTNHRLHHALGDLYREAKLLDMAEKSYRRALQHGPEVSHCFAYSALACVAYENGDIEQCRQWLRKSISLNHGRHAQGWVAMAQLEESEDNIQSARSICIAATSLYERRLLSRSRRAKDYQYRDLGTALSAQMDLGEDYTDMLSQVPVYRSGDRFLKVYRNWARLEERYGDLNSVEEVYRRATAVFPTEWKLYLDWADYHANRKHETRARDLFAQACGIAANRHAEPYRTYGEYEMSIGNLTSARKILYRGALAMSQSTDGGFGNHRGMAELLHTWAVCEWHLGNLARAESLFDHALRLTDPGNDGSTLRAFILFSIASLEFFKGENILAQHCVSLCLKEHSLPGGDNRAWELWADVATAMKNHELASECREYAERSSQRRQGAAISETMTSILMTRRSGSPTVQESAKGYDMQSLMRRDPWHYKLFDVGNHDRSTKFFDLELPVKDEYSL